MLEQFGKSVPIDVIVSCRNQIGEGPIWLEDQQRIVWVDITQHLIQWFDPVSGTVEVLDVGKDVGAVAPTTSGGLVAALPGEFVLISHPGRDIRTVGRFEENKPNNRMNDGKCDSLGRFWAGTMAYDLETSAAALYRLNTDCTVDVMVAPVTLSNGIGWSPDNRLMYYVDSPTQSVDMFDYESTTGTLRNRRTFVQIPKEAGLPDGLTVDADGYVWVALWEGGALWRLAQNGQLDMILELPVSQVTSCTFGGSDLSDLYITSAATGLSETRRRAEPQAGNLFRCEPGPRGLPAHCFAGCQ